MQMPQIAWLILRRSRARRHASRHFRTSRSSSRGIPGLHSAPVAARAGQALTQRPHTPQRERSIGAATGRSASVSTVASRSAEPKDFVTSSPVRPIQPQPLLSPRSRGAGVERSAASSPGRGEGRRRRPQVPQPPGRRLGELIEEAVRPLALAGVLQRRAGQDVGDYLLVESHGDGYPTRQALPWFGRDAAEIRDADQGGPTIYEEPLEFVHGDHRGGSAPRAVEVLQRDRRRRTQFAARPRTLEVLRREGPP